MVRYSALCSNHAQYVSFNPNTCWVAAPVLPLCGVGAGKHTHTTTTAVCLQIDVGIKGVAPGYNTQQFLQQKVRQCKFWGGLALAGLAVSAHLFDQLCLNVVGTTLATTSLVIIVGAVLQTSRQVSQSRHRCVNATLLCWAGPHSTCCVGCLLLQVESLLEGPRLQHKLDNERAIIQSLNML